MKKQTLNEEVSKIKSMMGLINENMDEQGVEQLQSDLADAGIEPLSDQEINELQPDCPVDTSGVPEEGREALEKLKRIVDNTKDRATLINMIKEVKRAMREHKNKTKNIKEQIGVDSTLKIFGVTITPGMFYIVLGILLLIMIIGVAKTLIRNAKGSSGCGRRVALGQRFGISDLV